MANILKTFGHNIVRTFSPSTYRRSPDEDGFYPVNVFYNTSPVFNDYTGENEKYNAVFTNPALLKVFALQCDLFSLGKVKVLSKEGVEVPGDPFLSLIKDPNYPQSGRQFLWDLMFNYMVGNVYCYCDNNIANDSNILQFLESRKIEWPTDFDKQKDKIILSEKTFKNVQDTIIKYRYEDGSTTDIKLSKIEILTDLSNGQGNWYKGPSRIDALYKILSNADQSLDSTNINIRMSGKFLVAGQADPKDVSKLPMSETEKQSIEQKVNGNKKVHAVKSLVDIKRFVENAKQLGLDEAYRTAYFLIGSMYNIPRDVLEAYLQGSTYDNQEKSTAKHVSYTLQPKGDEFFNALAVRFGYDNAGKTITITWEHLPFMQVFEKDRADVNKKNMETMTGLLKLGIPLEEINKQLGTKFTNAKYEQPKVNTGGN